MKAIWNNIVIAEANKEDLIYIEGNWYFSSVISVAGSIVSTTVPLAPQ